MSLVKSDLNPCGDARARVGDGQSEGHLLSLVEIGLDPYEDLHLRRGRIQGRSVELWLNQASNRLEQHQGGCACILGVGTRGATWAGLA